MNSTIKTIAERTSLRDYSSEPVTEEEERIILNAAFRAPTAGNQMLYSIIKITDSSLKNSLAELCDNQSFIAKAPLVLAFIADHHKWSDYYRMHHIDDYCKRNRLPYEDVDSGDLVLAFQDTMIAAQNAVIAAQSVNIGSCYIGDFLENYETIRELLKLPPETFPLTLLCFGHFKQGHKPVIRERFAEKYMVYENTYKQLTEEEYQDMFSEKEKTFNPQNHYNAENFAEQFYGRKVSAPFHHEMNRSVKVALKKWNK